MANVLEIQPAQWDQVPQPNVLVLPQLMPSKTPLVPLPSLQGGEGIGKAWLYTDGPCPGGTCELLVHDRSSGWWWSPAGGGCDGVTVVKPNNGLAYGQVISFAVWAAALVAGVDLQDGSASSFCPIPLPGWVSLIAGVGVIPPCFIDGWTIACGDTVLTVDLQFQLAQQASCAAPDTDYVAGVCPSGFFPDPNLPGCCAPLAMPTPDPPVPDFLRNLAGPTHARFTSMVPLEHAATRGRIRSTRFAPSRILKASPPPLPALNVQPLPQSCGCKNGPASEELDAL